MREKVAILSELDPWDIHTDMDVASDDLLDLFSLASSMIEYKTEYLVSCPYPHFPQLLFREVEFCSSATKIITAVTHKLVNPTYSLISSGRKEFK